MRNHGSVIIADSDPMVSMGLSSLIDWTKYNLAPDDNYTGIPGIEYKSDCGLILCEDLLLQSLSNSEKQDLKTRPGDIKLIILTRNICPESYETAFQVKADELMEKPVDMKALISILETEKNYDPGPGNTRTLWDPLLREQLYRFAFSPIEAAQIEDTHLPESLYFQKHYYLFNIKTASQKILDSLDRLAEDMLHDSFELLPLCRRIDELFYIVFPAGAGGEVEAGDLLSTKIEDLISMIYNLTGESATAALSSAGTTIYDIGELRKQCESNLEQRFYEGNRKVFSQRKNEYRTAGLLIDMEDCRKLISLVREGKTVHLKGKIAECVRGLHTDLTPSLAKHQLMDLMIKILALETGQGKLPERTPGYFGNVLEKLAKLETLEESLTLISSIAEEISERIYHCQNQHSSVIIARVKTYMEENFRQPITVETVAKNCYISPGYLSRLFKKQCGLTCQQYLIQLRLDHARRLLLDSNYKTGEIAERSGIFDPNYFSRLFKKNFHMSPTQYRARHLSY